jgi:WD40 repeat protein
MHSGHSRHTAAVSSVCWFPVDTGLFFTAGSDCRVLAWDANVFETVEEIVFDSAVRRRLCCSPSVARVDRERSPPRCACVQVHALAVPPTCSMHTNVAGTFAWASSTAASARLRL